MSASEHEEGDVLDTGSVESLDFEEQLVSDLEIDENDLTGSMKGVPILYFQYAKAHAVSRLQCDHMKLRYEVTLAACDHEIRESPERFGIGKRMTEAAVASAIASHPSAHAAAQELAQAKYEVAMLNAAKLAIEMKRDTLENMVRLKALELSVSGELGPSPVTKELAKREQAGLKRKVLTSLNRTTSAETENEES